MPLEECLRLTQISTVRSPAHNELLEAYHKKDLFESVTEPWTWPLSAVVPGGILMSECAVAAYYTVPTDFVLNSVQSHFVGGPDPKKPMQFSVTRPSNGRRFAVRHVVAKQDGRILLTATIQFVNGAAWAGPAMTYSVSRQTSHTISDITLDDLEIGRHKLGPFMKSQRLPLVYKGLAVSHLLYSC